MKINLSYSSRFQPAAEDYFKIPHESLQRTGLTGFHERTISRTSGLAKDKARWRLINIFMRTCPKNLREVRLLTNPGAWWHFERVISGRLEYQKQRAVFICCEKDPQLFKLSAVMMARMFPASGAIVHNEAEVSSRKRGRTLFRRDVFEYLPTHTGQQFSGVWLDLTSTMTEGLTDKLALLGPTLRPEYCMVAITLIRGREQGAVRDALKEGKSRKRYLEKLVKDGCGKDFVLTDICNYCESIPMQQIVFLRGASLGENAPKWVPKGALSLNEKAVKIG